MANPQALAVAQLILDLGNTPPGSPNSQAFHRARRAELEAAGIDRGIIQGIYDAAVFATQPPTPAVPAAGGQGLVPPNPPNAPNAPRVGGVQNINNERVPWVGGGTTARTRLTGPALLTATRPLKLETALKVEKECTAGLPETRRLPPPGAVDTKDESQSVMLTTWLRVLSVQIKRCGLDTVFRATIDGAEVFLLEKWGKATREIVNSHVDALIALNDPYNLKNLSMSATYMFNSLDDDMLKGTW
jgi:hypothetical protein